jgi:hypothetical protein
VLQRHKAGERLFVDLNGLKAKISDHKTGQVKEHPVFVAALRMSKYIFCMVYESEALRNWVCAHVEVFQLCGALPGWLPPTILELRMRKPAGSNPFSIQPMRNWRNSMGSRLSPPEWD